MPDSPIRLSPRALAQAVNTHALHYALRRRLPHVLRGKPGGSLLFREDEQTGHGNFLPASYSAILSNTAWRARLNKPHTAGPRSRALADWRWRELDCAVSSDALLMNIFCHPEAFLCPRLLALLGVAADAQPIFGVHPHLALRSGHTDATEIDMLLGDLLIEAKLTEGDFQTAHPALIDRLLDLDAVFHRDALPRTRARITGAAWDEAALAWRPTYCGENGSYTHYQLIRSVLAAYASGLRFCVLCDARRADMHEAWLSVQEAVTHADLRWRLQLCTWQEIAACVPDALRSFLAEKYGIEAA